MKTFVLLSSFVLSALASSSVLPALNPQQNAQKACSLLKLAFPNLTFFPGSSQYASDIAHFEFSSTQNATCSVEPTSPEDVSTILNIVGRSDIRSPFAVKAGGHATNHGFSSTTGVQISMTNFRNTTYDPETNTVTLQPGKTWDQIYADLSAFNVTVAGGRVPGVGVGLSLGGGYSWITDQVGLSIDNIIAADLVLPNGTFIHVTDASNPELMFGIRGGLNNFGIVTTLTFNAIPIGDFWAGVIDYDPTVPEVHDQIIQAIENFSLNNTNTKAQIAAAYVNTNGTNIWELIFSHSEPQVPDVFLPFLNISNISSDVGTRSFVDFISIVNPINPDAFSRAWSNMVPILKYTETVLLAIEDNVNAAFAAAVSDGRSIDTIILGVEPFFGANDHNLPSAFPHPASRPVTPCNPWMIYSNPADDTYFNTALLNISNQIQAVAVAQNQSSWDDIRYINYVLENTPLELLYGSNLPQLRTLQQAIDPNNVMGLTGGFKL